MKHLFYKLLYISLLLYEIENKNIYLLNPHFENETHFARHFEDLPQLGLISVDSYI